MLTAALALTGAAVCAGAQSRSAKHGARASKKRTSPTAQPAAETTPSETTPSETTPAGADPAAKRNARAVETTKSQTSDAPASPVSPPPVADGAKSPGAGEAKTIEQYVYEFENPEFIVNRIRVEHDAAGRGRIVFERRSYVEPVVEPFEFSPAALGRVRAHWEALRFLDSDASYQTEKQFPHLGVTRLKMRAGGRERATEFNYTHDREAGGLASEYRRAADQAIFVFDLGVARENQPLEAPKLLDALDRMIKHNMISDPAQLVPILRELETDERLPLIARNHAARLLKKLAK